MQEASASDRGNAFGSADAAETRWNFADTTQAPNSLLSSTAHADTLPFLWLTHKTEHHFLCTKVDASHALGAYLREIPPRIRSNPRSQNQSHGGLGSQYDIKRTALGSLPAKNSRRYRHANDEYDHESPDITKMQSKRITRPRPSEK